MKFTDLTLKPEILKAVHKMGYEELTPIQEKTFPHILADRDIIATAETGSGKTSACGIPLVQQINPNTTSIQALILVPTRELALQYVDEINKIGRYIKVVPFAIYGGFDAEIQKAKLRDLVHILIATPGRLIDLIYSGNVSLNDVRTFVLDEADEMLNQGFLEDIDFIFSCMVQKHVTLLFSATMPPEIKKLTKTYLNDPVTIQLNVENIAPQSLEHKFTVIHFGNRRKFLEKILREEHVDQAIIFCNSRRNAEHLYHKLKETISGVELIHGGFEQEKRTSIIRKFRSGKIRYMVATDLAGRGLDFRHVSHVLNYDFPPDTVTYTHRTGRTGRMGRTGTALTFVTNRDIKFMPRLLGRNKITPVWLGKKPHLNRTQKYRKPPRRKVIKKPSSSKKPRN